MLKGTPGLLMGGKGLGEVGAELRERGGLVAESGASEHGGESGPGQSQALLDAQTHWLSAVRAGLAALPP